MLNCPISQSIVAARSGLVPPFLELLARQFFIFSKQNKYLVKKELLDNNANSLG